MRGGKQRSSKKKDNGVSFATPKILLILRNMYLLFVSRCSWSVGLPRKTVKMGDIWRKSKII